jgi:hypothetical protein
MRTVNNIQAHAKTAKTDAKPQPETKTAPKTQTKQPSPHPKKNSTTHTNRQTPQPHQNTPQKTVTVTFFNKTQQQFQNPTQTTKHSE